ncbi:MAG: hypothetical protein HUU37_05125 [Bdellovibrionales bacterium]|nr:hypothetical protein [Bdellovibrionales bacterium]
MKRTPTLTLAAIAMIATMGSASVAQANHNHRPRPRPGYGAGFMDGLVASTMGIFTTHTLSEHYKELVMLGADEEAAAWLNSDTEPSAMLWEAMNLERAILKDGGVDTALSDEDVAWLIVKRSARWEK